MTNQYESEYTVVKSKEKKEGVKMQALSTAVPGKWYTIKWMFGVPEVLEKLKEFKIKEGCEIHVIQNDASGMMIIASDQKRFAISQDAAARIQV